jgi:hypothetical protein
MIPDTRLVIVIQVLYSVLFIAVFSFILPCTVLIGGAQVMILRFGRFPRTGYSVRIQNTVKQSEKTGSFLQNMNGYFTKQQGLVCLPEAFAVSP